MTAAGIIIFICLVLLVLALVKAFAWVLSGPVIVILLLILLGLALTGNLK